MSRAGVRVYLPATAAGLRALLAGDGLGPSPLTAHAVTDGVRAALPDGGDEEWEYAASAAAAQASLALLGPERPRRMVVAADVARVRPAAGDDPTEVEVDGDVPLRLVAAVLADTAEAEDDVARAVRALAEGAADADDLAERCLDHELGWWATQEIPDLLDDTGA